MRVYIAGPMEGMPERNFPAFYKVAVELKDLGYDTFNPAQATELDELVYFSQHNVKANFSFEHHMKRDITALLTCNLVVVLPDWELSKGFALEKEIAGRVGIPICTVDEIMSWHLEWKNLLPAEILENVKNNSRIKLCDVGLHHLARLAGKWSNEKFSSDRSPKAPLKHLQNELEKEFFRVEEYYNLEEYADLFLLVLDAARLAGFTSEQLLSASFEKYKINKARKWGKPNAEGFTEHIKEDL